MSQVCVYVYVYVCVCVCVCVCVYPTLTLLDYRTKAFRCMHIHVYSRLDDFHGTHMQKHVHDTQNQLKGGHRVERADGMDE